MIEMKYHLNSIYLQYLTVIILNPCYSMLVYHQQQTPSCQGVFTTSNTPPPQRLSDEGKV
jgi:hypothetical protein